MQIRSFSDYCTPRHTRTAEKRSPIIGTLRYFHHNFTFSEEYTKYLALSPGNTHFSMLHAERGRPGMQRHARDARDRSDLIERGQDYKRKAIMPTRTRYSSMCSRRRLVQTYQF